MKVYIYKEAHMPAKTTTTAATRTTTQTVRINGARVRLTTKDGRVTMKPAPVEEWLLQAAIVRALRSMPEYAATAAGAKPGTFTLAGDFNAARRSMREAAKAKATGLTPGEADLRLYIYGGRLALIEVKGGAAVSKAQRERHALLAALGFTRQAVLRATTPEDAAAQAVALVRGWLANNDNTKTTTAA